MKKALVFCLLIIMTCEISGCQSAGKENDNMSADISLQDAEEIASPPAETENVLNHTTDTAESNEGTTDHTDNIDNTNDIDDINNSEASGERTYNAEEFGTIYEIRQEYFADGAEVMSYYYEMENFFFNDTAQGASSINHTLQQIYDEYEEGCIETASEYSGDDFLDTPYSYWHLLSLTYVSDDYVSILYNDINYMGGAHPYSSFDGITIDCKTGEQVLASQLLGKSDDEILAEVSDAMGLDYPCGWDELDFYITDSEIVFFYRMPGFWEDVVLRR